MDEKVYWIWLQQALKYGNHKVKDAVFAYETLKQFYESGEYGWRLCGFFNNSEIYSLKTTSLVLAEEIFRVTKKLGYNMLTLLDEEYPKLLSNISNPPLVIYAKGDTSILNRKIIMSVVGTRDATRYGSKMAYEISYKIAKKGGVVVSGGAVGIDTAAHRGALKAGGKTIGVLGCGINFKYLLENKYLRDAISNSGVLISEYPPNHPAFRYNFPMRNRIISGLSLATIVVEAGRRSGSLITANLANEQNRDVFICTPEDESVMSTGSKVLMNDGAEILTDIEEVIENYNKTLSNEISIEKIKALKVNYGVQTSLKGFHPEEEVKDQKKFPSISKSAKMVYDLMGNDKIHIDKICELSDLSVKDLFSILMELEMCGLIKSYPGKEYQKIIFKI